MFTFAALLPSQH